MSPFERFKQCHCMFRVPLPSIKFQGALIAPNRIHADPVATVLPEVFLGLFHEPRADARPAIVGEDEEFNDYFFPTSFNGNSMKNVVPLPSSLVNHILPPCPSMAPFAT